MLLVQFPPFPQLLIRTEALRVCARALEGVDGCIGGWWEGEGEEGFPDVAAEVGGCVVGAGVGELFEGLVGLLNVSASDQMK